jgi:hypothetical protein
MVRQDLQEHYCPIYQAQHLRNTYTLKGRTNIPDAEGTVLGKAAAGSNVTGSLVIPISQA